VLLCSAQPGWASPDRLDNAIPDAMPDDPGTVAFSLGEEWLKLDGTLNSENTTHSLFKLRYQFNPKVAGTIGFAHHDLTGDLGIINPVFDNLDKADSWNFDIGMNLMNTPREAADEANKKPFGPGSAFTVGVAGEFDHGSAGAVGESTTLLKAYLMYSTDLTEEMRAHTYFSSGRITGGGRNGSVNTVGAGLDYDLSTGDHPLTLMADGILDIYNFRDPTFNTSRVSRFDVGLRYKMSDQLYANAGWMTANDSENNASGSGLFAGLNWVQDKNQKCTTCAPDTTKKDDKAAPAAAPKADAGSGQLSAAADQQSVGAAGTSPEPPMMDTPALKYPDSRLEAGLRGTDGLLAANNNTEADQSSSRSSEPQRAEPPLPLFSDDSDHKPAAPTTGDRVAASAAPASPAPPAAAKTETSRSTPAARSEAVVPPQPPKDHGQVVDLKSAGSASAAPADTAPSPAAEPPQPQTMAQAPAEETTPAADQAPSEIDRRQSELERRLDAADKEVQAALDDSASGRRAAGAAPSAPAEETTPADSAAPAAAPEAGPDKYTPTTSRFAFPEDAERQPKDQKSKAKPSNGKALQTGKTEAKPAPAETKPAAKAADAAPGNAKPHEPGVAPMARPAPPAAKPAASAPAKPSPAKAQPGEVKTVKPETPGATLLPIENAPASGLSPADDKGASSAPADTSPSDSTPAPVVEAKADQPWSNASPAPADDKSTEIPLPAFITGAGSDSAPAAPAAPAAAPHNSAGKPRHVEAADRMQRPPISASAQEGLAKLVSMLKLSNSDAKAPADDASLQANAAALQP
jgi:hypothetical protein